MSSMLPNGDKVQVQGLVQAYNIFTSPLFRAYFPLLDHALWIHIVIIIIMLLLIQNGQMVELQ